jgi:hypothetical protein
MHSQKKARDRSIMSYCPKEKTYSRTMALTSMINIMIGIDTLGYAKFYDELFAAMQFSNTQLTFSVRIETSVEKEGVWKDILWAEKGEEEAMH